MPLICPGTGMPLEARAGVPSSSHAQRVLVVATLTWVPFAATNAAAQSAAAPRRPPAERQLQLRDERLLKKYVWSTLGPVGLLHAGVEASVDQWREQPEQWQQDSAGYVKRFSSDYAAGVIGGSTKYALAHLFRQDPSFERCTCRRFVQRLRHAAASPFTARAADGRRVFSVATVGGLAAENIIPAATWYPPPTGFDDGVYSASIGVMAKIAVDIAREFMPRRD